MKYGNIKKSFLYIFCQKQLLLTPKYTFNGRHQDLLWHSALDTVAIAINIITEK